MNKQTSRSAIDLVTRKMDLMFEIANEQDDKMSDEVGKVLMYLKEIHMNDGERWRTAGMAIEVIEKQQIEIEELKNLRFNNSHKINVFEKALKLSMETFKQNETENGCPESGVMAEHISELLEQI